MIQGHAKLMHDPLSKSVCCCQLARKGTEQGAKNRAEEQRYWLKRKDYHGKEEGTY